MSGNRKSILSMMTFVGCSRQLCGIEKRAGRRSSASPAEVKIDNFTFHEPTITVPVGTQVTWVNVMTFRTQW